MTNTTLEIGVNIDGVLHRDSLPTPDASTQFQMMARAGVFDYVEMNPPSGRDLEYYLGLSEQHGLPVRVIGGNFVAGRDEPHLRHLIDWVPRFGAKVLNCQLFSRHSDGHALTDLEVVRFYLDAYELAQPFGCTPSLEVHVDMWNEDFTRVARVGEMLAAQGVDLGITLDHSHLVFKIGNDEELDVSGVRHLVESGELVLDPASPDAIFKQWVARGWVCHAHARSVAPNNPQNPRQSRADGRPGRGIQYPFVRPAREAWHGDWDEAALEPWKEAVRHLLQARVDGNPATPARISCEFIPFPDYGGGAGYSIFENNVACAKWLRDEWNAAIAARSQAA